MAAELSSVPPHRQDTYPTPGRPGRRLLRSTATRSEDESGEGAASAASPALTSSNLIPGCPLGSTGSASLGANSDRNPRAGRSPPGRLAAVRAVPSVAGVATAVAAAGSRLFERGA